MSTDSFSIHSVSDCNATILCANKTKQAMNRLNEKKLGTVPDNPGMGDINDITASTQERTKSDTEQFRKIHGTYQKSVAADSVLHSTLPHQINITHKLLIAKIQIQRE